MLKISELFVSCTAYKKYSSNNFRARFKAKRYSCLKVVKTIRKNNCHDQGSSYDRWGHQKSENRSQNYSPGFFVCSTKSISCKHFLRTNSTSIICGRYDLYFTNYESMRAFWEDKKQTRENFPVTRKFISGEMCIYAPTGCIFLMTVLTDMYWHD